MQWSRAFSFVYVMALTNKLGIAIELTSNVTSLRSPFNYASFKWTRVFYLLPFVALKIR